MSELNIGTKIQKYRERKNISQKELAQRIHISPSMMSQIERGTANPSLGTIKLISRELQVPLYYLFVEDNQEKEIIVRRDSRRRIGSRGGSGSHLEMLTPDTAGVIEFLMMTLQPGTENSRELMNHDSEEVAYVVKGRIRLVLEDALYDMEEGDSVRLPHLTLHRWENIGDRETVLIFAVTPPNF